MSPSRVLIGLVVINSYFLPCLSQDECPLSLFVSSPRRTAPHIEQRVRPRVKNDTICQSDPRSQDPMRRLLVSIKVQSENCQPVVGARLLVSQADTSGIERYDCGGELVTQQDGRIMLTTVRPKAYEDIKYPSTLRPRLIQIEVMPSGGCSYTGLEEEENFITQFYFKKDKLRKSDPCPEAKCHAHNEISFFRMCSRTSTHRQCNITITLPRLRCEMEPTTARSFREPTTAAVFPTVTQPACIRPHATQWDTPGPFYRDNQPYRNPMCVDDPGFERQTKLTLNLKLSDRSCRQLTSFYVDVWSADSRGAYRDYCRSLLTTNSSGMFTLSTIKPAPYPGRPVHLHFLVHATQVDNMCYRLFTTQSYFAERYDYASLVKPCRDQFEAGQKVGLNCDFHIILHDPVPC